MLVKSGFHFDSSIWGFLFAKKKKYSHVVSFLKNWGLRPLRLCDLSSWSAFSNSFSFLSSLVKSDIAVESLCHCLVTQSCLTLCDPTDCSPWGSSVHGISQARILEWVTLSFSRSYWPRHQTHISCIGSQNLYHWATGKPMESQYQPRERPNVTNGPCGGPSSRTECACPWTVWCRKCQVACSLQMSPPPARRCTQSALHHVKSSVPLGLHENAHGTWKLWRGKLLGTRMDFHAILLEKKTAEFWLQNPCTKSCVA